MKRSTFFTFAVMLLGIALLFFNTRIARAVDVPSVSDGAGYFSPASVQQADTIIHQIKQSYGYDVQVETFPSIPADVAATRGDKSETEFYEDWLRDNANRENINGIYVLVVRNPRYLKVGIGNQTARKAFTQANKARLADIMRAAFHQNQFDRGLLDGLQYVQQQMGDNLNNASAPQNSVVPYSRGGYNPPQTSGGTGPYGQPYGQPKPPVLFSWFGWFVLIVIGLIVLNVIRGMINRHRFIGSNYGPGAGPGYIDPAIGNYQNYGPGYGNYGGYGGGGGFGRGFLGGMLGGAAGSWLYDRFNNTAQYPSQTNDPPPPPSAGGDFSGGSGGGDSGGDLGGGGGGGGGGGDFGGGGGGDFGGGGGGGGGDSGGGSF